MAGCKYCTNQYQELNADGVCYNCTLIEHPSESPVVEEPVTNFPPPAV